MNGKWSVEGIISHEYSGSNFDQEKNPDSCTGGVNGLGIKLININSVRFEVETVDWINKKFYRQVCEDRMDVVNPPLVVDLNDPTSADYKALSSVERIPHTTIRFIPDYANLCKKSANTPDPKWFNPTNAENFAKVMEFRVYEVAAFIASINYRYWDLRRIEYRNKASVYFNDELIRVSDLGDFAKMFGVDQSVEVELSHSREEMNKLMEESENPKACGIRFPWYLSFGLNPIKKFEQVAIVNGVHVQGGSHCDMIFNHLVEQLTPRITRLTKGSNVKFTESMLKNLLFVIDCKQISCPQFSSQTKDSLKIGTSELNDMKKNFVLPKKVVDQVWKMVKDQFEFNLATKEVAEGKKKKKDNIPIRKYSKAEKLGLDSMLFIPEGDSAAKPIRDIIHSDTSPLNYKRCGMYNIQGVPMNALKKIKKIIIAGITQIKKHKTLMANVGLQGLVRVIGLDYNEDYYYGPPEEDPRIDDLSDEDIEALRQRRKRGDEAFSKLNYGCMIITTDQDLDGIGQICSLLLVFIMVFWPELIKRGFVRRLATPIIRVYHGKDVFNFYSKKEFQKWALEMWGGEDKKPNGWEVNYYKGLAGHSEEEVLKDIGGNLLDNIYTFTWDDAAEAAMNLLYGSETKGRKSILQSPVTDEYDPELFDDQKIKCSSHFMIEAKSFQLDFMRRKLKSAIDGFIPSQRKAFAGARIMYRKEAKAKVCELTGYVTKKMGYEHGDAPMNETITKMAQVFTGANNIPPMIPISNGFGDRVDGRGVTGSPRYIYLKYNARAMNLVFPREDDWLLEYEYEDGKQCEPTHYVPIIPYSILETSTTAGVGWKMGCWARDFKHTMHILRQMINYEYPNPGSEPSSLQGHAWVPKGMKVEVGRFQNGKIACEICTGTYEYDEERNQIIIKQLPLKIWSFYYRCKILGIDPDNGKTEDKEGTPFPRKDLVKDCIDHTANDKNHIIIKLEPGAMEKLESPESNYGNEYLDPIESYLELAQQMQPHLNMIIEDGSIKEFTAYEDIMKQWFPLRRQLYELRLQRQLILLRLTIQFHENELRFIKMDATKEINIDKDLEDEARIEILEGAHFVRFNKKNLFSPKYTKTDVLERSIIDPTEGASYDYIDDITIRMKSKKNMIALEKKIAELKAELDELEKQTWKKLWLKELTDLEAIIYEGIKTKWLFGAKQHIFKKAEKRKKPKTKKQSVEGLLKDG
jgi:DNA gyrase/topoisomerase IV subunit B